MTDTDLITSMAQMSDKPHKMTIKSLYAKQKKKYELKTLRVEQRIRRGDTNTSESEIESGKEQDRKPAASSPDNSSNSSDDSSSSSSSSESDNWEVGGNDEIFNTKKIVQKQEMWKILQLVNTIII